MKVPLFICGNQNLYSEECTLVIAIQKILKIITKINKHMVRGSLEF